MSNFWTDGTVEPKRQNRWVIQFDGIYGGNMFFATQVDRPAIEVTSKEHKYLNHTFNYPGRVSWKPVMLTLVDPGGTGGSTPTNLDAMGNLMSILSGSGYIVPGNEKALKTIAKKNAITQAATARAGAEQSVGFLDNTVTNGIVLTMVDADGAQVEKWTLKNAYITKITPSKLSYEDDNLATVDVEIVYDYCEFEPAARNVVYNVPVSVD